MLSNLQLLGEWLGGWEWGLLAVAGILLIGRYQRGLGWVTAAAVLASVAAVSRYNTAESMPFLCLTRLFWVLWLAAIASFLWGAAREASGRLKAVLLALVSAGLAITLVLTCSGRELGEARIAGRGPAEVIETVLGSLPPQSVLVTERSDLVFLSWYLQQIEHRRQDVTVVFRHLLSLAWYHRQLAAEGKAWPDLPEAAFEDSEAFNTASVWSMALWNRPRRPVCFLEPTALERKELAGRELALIPYGAVLRLCSTDEQPAGPGVTPLHLIADAAAGRDRMTREQAGRLIWLGAHYRLASDPLEADRLIQRLETLVPEMALDRR
jgi:hypothetical protein